MAPSHHKQCFHFHAEPSDIHKCVREGHFVFIMMRGAPGSGKTTLARQFIESLDSSDYTHHVVDNNQSPQKFNKDVRTSLSGKRLVIIDADHEERSYISKMVKMAIEEEYEVFVVEPSNPWKYSAEECAMRTSRSEDVETIRGKIRTIRDNQITWDHLVAGGEKNVRISNFHANDIPMHSPATPRTTPPTSSSVSSPMFSMVPHKNEKSMRSVGIQVGPQNIARGLAGLPDDADSGCHPENVQIVPEVWKADLRTSERCVQSSEDLLLEGTTQEIEFGMVRAVYQELELGCLRHYLQMLGFEETMFLFDGLNERASKGILPTDDRLLWDELAMEESLSVSTVSIEDEMRQRELERRTLKFIEDRNHINQETANDEQIARLLQSEMDAEQFEEKERAEDRCILDLLCKMFPTTKRLIIENTYFDASERNMGNAIEFLVDEGHYRDMSVQPEQPKPNSYSRKVIAKTPIVQYRAADKSLAEQHNHFLKASGSNVKYNLSAVQHLAYEMRQQMLYDRQELKDNGVRGRFRNQALCERVISQKANIEKGVADINEKIRRAHASPWNLDLHYMSVEGAKSLVMEAVEAVRYHMRGGKVVNRITVITGSGNNSRGGAKIKPEVANMLKREGLPFEQINEGCISVKV